QLEPGEGPVVAQSLDAEMPAAGARAEERLALRQAAARAAARCPFDPGGGGAGRGTARGTARDRRGARHLFPDHARSLRGGAEGAVGGYFLPAPERAGCGMTTSRR